MKWYKHLSGSLNNSVIFEAIEKFGGDGYLVFFGILELMSDEFDIHNPGVNRLSLKKITKNLQLSRQKTVKILAFFDQKAKEKPKENKSFLVEFEKDHVIINCSRLAMLSDNHTAKLLRETSKLLQSENKATSLQEEEVRSKKKTITPKTRKESKYFLTDSQPYQLAKRLSDHISFRNENYIQPNMQKWAKTFDVMITKDKIGFEKLKHVIDWCQKDFEHNGGRWKGWATVILSPTNLKKHFNKLIEQMEDSRVIEVPQPPIEELEA